MSWTKLEARSVRSLIAEYRQAMFARYDRPLGVWGNWGDPGYTQFLSNFVLAETLKDGEWLRLANYCLQNLNDSKAEELTRRTTENQLEFIATTGCARWD